MNIQQLEYIVALDRLKNFTRAAEACFVTQATLSAMVKKLEEELAVVIFDRSVQPMITTDAGAVIIEEAKKIMLHAHLLKEKAKNAEGLVEGTIRIGVIPTIANSLLPKIIKPILETYPKLKLELTEVTTAGILKQLREGSIDAGLLATPVNEEEMEEEILYYEALMVYGKTGKKTRYLIPEEIRTRKIWLLEEGHCLRDQFIKLCALKKKEAGPVNLRFEAGSFDTLLNMVDVFGGLTLIPELYYQSLPANKKKKVSFFNRPLPVREVSLVYYRPYARKRIISALSSLIRELIVKELSTRNYKNKDLAIARV